MTDSENGRQHEEQAAHEGLEPVAPSADVSVGPTLASSDGSGPEVDASGQGAPVVDAPVDDSTQADPVGAELIRFAEIDDIDQLRDLAMTQFGELSQVKAERDQHLDALMRTQAEFANYRKRMLRDQTEMLERASIRILEALLPVLDSLDLAIASASEHEGIKSGLEVFESQLLGILHKEGLERIAPEAGAPFDPIEQEPVAHIPGEGEQAVSKVLRAGYRLKGRLLRPAMVEVQG